jgi:hypothetical protein
VGKSTRDWGVARKNGEVSRRDYISKKGVFLGDTGTFLGNTGVFLGNKFEFIQIRAALDTRRFHRIRGIIGRQIHRKGLCKGILF